ncbi:DUF397 domain-containing protein [Streptomyces sp. ISL-100]|nr:DUF397 domain-containing protein [Streptomyces sp. ISL-100]
MAPDFEGAAWRKSKYSGDSQGQCFECADVTATHNGVAVRDSKDPQGPALLFTTEAFTGFIEAVSRNEFTQP